MKDHNSQWYPHEAVIPLLVIIRRLRILCVALSVVSIVNGVLLLVAILVAPPAHWGMMIRNFFQ